MTWFWWHHINTTAGRLLFLSRKWQVQHIKGWKLKCWRVKDFGWGVRIGPLDIVRLPDIEREE